MIEKKIGKIYQIRFAKNIAKTMALFQNLVIAVYIGYFLSWHSLESNSVGQGTCFHLAYFMFLQCSAEMHYHYTLS